MVNWFFLEHNYNKNLFWRYLPSKRNIYLQLDEYFGELQEEFRIFFYTD